MGEARRQDRATKWKPLIRRGGGGQDSRIEGQHRVAQVVWGGGGATSEKAQAGDLKSPNSGK